MKGFFIPLEFGKLKLTQIEEKLLATYRYYTIKGDYHHCALTNKKLAEMLYVNERSIKRAKKHLKNLGYIKTNGGIRVWYVGIGVEETVDDVEEVDEQVNEVDEVEEQVNETEMSETKPVEEEVDEKVEEQVKKTEITENEKVIEQVEETNNKIDNKKDIVMEKSNVERIIDTLGDFYKTPEKLKYFYDKKQEWVDKINQADYKELVVSTCASQIKLVINTEFGYPEVEAIPNPKKKEVKSEEFEGCFI